MSAFRPLDGPHGLIFTADEKANVFSEVMEQQFSLNSEPYDEATIRLVQHTLRQTYLDHPFDPVDLTTPHEVQHVIHRLPGSSAAGPDIPNLALKIRLGSYLFSHDSSMLCSCIPTSHTIWKNAKVVIIPKIDKVHLFPVNHSPISLLPT